MFTLCLPYTVCVTVRGSYSLYADPLARRAIAVSVATKRLDEADLNHPIHPSRRLSVFTRRIRDPNQRQAIVSHYNKTYQSSSSGNYQAQQHPTSVHLPPYQQRMHAPGVSPFHGESILPPDRIFPQYQQHQPQYQQPPHAQLQSPQYDALRCDQSNASNSHATHQPFVPPPVYDVSAQYDGSFDYSMQQDHRSFRGGIARFQQEESITRESNHSLSGDDMFRPPTFQHAPPLSHRPPPALMSRQSNCYFSPSQPPIAQSPAVHQQPYGHNHDKYSFEANILQNDGPRSLVQQASKEQQQRYAPPQAPQDNGVDTFELPPYYQDAVIARPLEDVSIQRPFAYEIERRLPAHGFIEQQARRLPQYTQRMTNETAFDHFEEVMHRDSGDRFVHGMNRQVEQRPIQTSQHFPNQLATSVGIARFQKKGPQLDHPPFDSPIDSPFFIAEPGGGSGNSQCDNVPRIDDRLDLLEEDFPDKFDFSDHRSFEQTTIAVPEVAEFMGKKSDDSTIKIRTWNKLKADQRPATVPARLSIEKFPMAPFSNKTNLSPDPRNNNVFLNCLEKRSKPDSLKPNEISHFHEEFEQGERKCYPSVRNPSSCAHPQNLRFFNDGVEVDLENRSLCYARSPGDRKSESGLEDAWRNATSSIQNYSRSADYASDDDLDLAGKTSLWGGKKR